MCEVNRHVFTDFSTIFVLGLGTCCRRVGGRVHGLAALFYSTYLADRMTESSAVPTVFKAEMSETSRVPRRVLKDKWFGPPKSLPGRYVKPND